VHLAARAWPIVGDATYGSPDPSIARQALHAWRMTLPHPKSGERLTFEAPVARDMETLLRGPEGSAPLMDATLLHR
jgi:23S rRNA pseudouridine1911/1915/1917 synthase